MILQVFYQHTPRILAKSKIVLKDTSKQARQIHDTIKNTQKKANNSYVQESISKRNWFYYTSTY